MLVSAASAPVVNVAPPHPVVPATAAPTPAKAGAKNPYWVTVSPFVLGGTSGMIATSVIQPMDMIKVQIQLSGEGQKGKGVSGVSVAQKILKEKGVGFFYKGLSAGLLRQVRFLLPQLAPLLGTSCTCNTC